MADHIAPNPENYAVLKGSVYFTPAGGGGERHLGNAPGFSVETAVERLDHFSSMAGLRTKDRSVAIEKTITLTIQLDELNAENMRLLLMGTLSTDTDGNKVITVGDEDLIRGRIRYVGANSTGPKYTFDFPVVALSPSDSLELIAEDDWSAGTLTGDVEAQIVGDETVFYTATQQDTTVTE